MNIQQSLVEPITLTKWGFATVLDRKSNSKTLRVYGKSHETKGFILSKPIKEISDGNVFTEENSFKVEGHPLVDPHKYIKTKLRRLKNTQKPGGVLVFDVDYETNAPT